MAFDSEPENNGTDCQRPMRRRVPTASIFLCAFKFDLDISDDEFGFVRNFACTRVVSQIKRNVYAEHRPTPNRLWMIPTHLYLHNN